MKIVVFYVLSALFMVGCRPGANIMEAWPTSRFVWINQSDHMIEFIAREFKNSDPVEEIVLLDKMLQKGGAFQYEWSGGHMIYPETLEFSSVTVRFDDQIEVTYMREPDEFCHGNILSPEDYPATHGLFLESSYKRDIDKKEDITTYTYIFTNADYEAAREWADKQEYQQ